LYSRIAESGVCGLDCLVSGWDFLVPRPIKKGGREARRPPSKRGCTTGEPWVLFVFIVNPRS
jgi:hypothetical protein